MADSKGREDHDAILEAARRANWDALHGPRHLRRGEFNPAPVRTSVPDADNRTKAGSVGSGDQTHEEGAA